MRRIDRVLVAFVLAAVVGVQQAGAQTDITVSDGDVGALIAAIDSANADATGPRVIRLTRSTYTLTRAHAANPDDDGLGPSGLPDVVRDLTLEGNGASLLRSGVEELRFLKVKGAVLVARDLHLGSGFVSNGGGGAIYAGGSARCELTRCTFELNLSDSGSGGGALVAGAGSALRQCTLTQNTAPFGGAVDAPDGGVIVNNCTIVNNSAFSASSGGGGIHAGGTVTVESTILANNTASAAGPAGSGSFELTSCFVDDTTGMTITDGGGNVVGGVLVLGSLDDNGGLVRTCALRSGSDAIDAGANPDAQATDQRGAGFPRVNGAAIDMGAYEHSAVPIVARVSATDVKATGSSYQFNVRYVSDLASGGIDVTTLDGADLRVTGPNGFSEAASFVLVNVASSGSPRFAVYEVNAPLGGWAEGDNGTYTITLLADAVLDTAGQSVADGVVATFEVEIDGTAPTAAGAAPDVTAAGATTHTLTVTYTDATAVDVSTLDDDDLVVNPGALPATFMGVDVGTDGTPRVATYTITPPGGTWSAADNGTYTIALQAGEVEDTRGNATAAGSVGTFTVAIDTADPVAAATAPDVTDFGATTYTFVVAYTDDLAIDVSTLDDDDVVVNPGGLRATFVSVDSSSNGAAREATYRITPPDGSWNAADNDTYTIEVVAGEVTDTSGKAVPAGAVGTFTVSVVDPAAGRSSGDGCSMASAPSRSSSAWLPLGLLALVLFVSRRGRDA